MENITLVELFYGKKTNVNNLRVFESIANKHVPKQKQSGKFASKRDVCIMVGYTHNGYKLWDVDKHKVVDGRHVLFEESKMNWNTRCEVA